ncbi:MAG: Smr/MutS family protein [Usitatibacteraceae bacterium]
MGKTPADDEELFRAEMAGDGVVPLNLPTRATLQKTRPKPIAYKRIEDDLAIPGEMMKDTSGWDADIANGDLITFLRKGLPSDVLRKLKRGQWIVQASLDLHGLTVDAARIQLARFLGLARHDGVRCVRIVHGKGTRSPNNVALIRNKVRLSLSRRDEVLAFCDAAPADGGSGAVTVLLKAS